MNRRWHRVASRPTRTISSPVANGSSVPAWPVLAPRSLRTRATTSWEVAPRGLSTSSTPGPGGSAVTRDELATAPGLELRLDLGAEDLDQLRVREVGGESGGPRVAAPAVLAGDLGHVDPADRRAEADLARGPPAIRSIADHRRHLG